MPVAQPSSQHHHHLFSAIGTFLHALQPSSHHNPSSDSGSSGASSSLSRHGSSELSDLYQAFESQLAQRLSSLLPAEDSPSVNLASLKELMDLLLATQTDLRTLVPKNHKQVKSMEDFLERSIKLLDVCRGIKEQMLEMEGLQGMLRLAMFCLNTENQDLNKGQVSRARKALTQLVIHMEVEREDHTNHVHTHRSFREKLRERLHRESAPQRWHSWQRNHSGSSSSQGSLASASSTGHGNYTPAHAHSAGALGSASGHMAAPLLHGSHGVHGAAGSGAHAGGNLGSQTLHMLEVNLLPPRLPPKDAEECFAAAIYALNVLSIFSLGTISAALPSFGKTHNAVFIQPSHNALWATPFLRLQEKAGEELRKRSKRHGGYAGMWELDQISLHARRLIELISGDEFLELDDNKEEVKKVGRIFCQNVEELERDMGTLSSQISEYYNRIVAARMGVFDMLSDVDG